MELSQKERDAIRKPLETRGFEVIFDEDQKIVFAKKNGETIKTKYSFYRSAFGVPGV